MEKQCVVLRSYDTEVHAYLAAQHMAQLCGIFGVEVITNVVVIGVLVDGWVTSSTTIKIRTGTAPQKDPKTPPETTEGKY